MAQDESYMGFVDPKPKPNTIDYWLDSNGWRDIVLKYYYDTKIEEVPVRRYGVDQSFFAPKKQFLMVDDKCDVLPMAHTQQAYFPAVLSMPYLLNMNRSLYGSSEGTPFGTDEKAVKTCQTSKPKMEADFRPPLKDLVSFLDVEPISGAVFRANLRLQINWDLQATKDPLGRPFTSFIHPNFKIADQPRSARRLLPLPSGLYPTGWADQSSSSPVDFCSCFFFCQWLSHGYAPATTLGTSMSHAC